MPTVVHNALSYQLLLSTGFSQRHSFLTQKHIQLRPSLQNDPLFVPTVVRNAKAGKMKYIMGSGENLMDFTYVGELPSVVFELPSESTIMCCIWQNEVHCALCREPHGRHLGR